MFIVSQDFPGYSDQVERCYGTKYRLREIPKDFLEKINSCTKDSLPQLHLPHRNTFIPTNLEMEKRVIGQPVTAPKLIRNNNGVRAWYKMDDKFGVPRTNMFINCRNPLLGTMAENVLKAKVCGLMLENELKEYSYAATLAGLKYNISANPAGLEIHISGYSERYPDLLDKVLTTIRDLQIKLD